MAMLHVSSRPSQVNHGLHELNAKAPTVTKRLKLKNLGYAALLRPRCERLRSNSVRLGLLWSSFDAVISDQVSFGHAFYRLPGSGSQDKKVRRARDFQSWALPGARDGERSGWVPSSMRVDPKLGRATAVQGGFYWNSGGILLGQRNTCRPRRAAIGIPAGCPRRDCPGIPWGVRTAPSLGVEFRAW